MTTKKRGDEEGIETEGIDEDKKAAAAEDEHGSNNKRAKNKTRRTKEE